MQRVAQKQTGFTIVELLIVIVVIAILAAITIVAYTGIQERAQQSAKTSTLSQWKTQSELYKVEHNIECPENYAFVYGNATLGTTDFCVMKYEAKNVGGVATSQAAGTPWVNVSEATAATAATATGGHLITEAEWMTIAADMLTVPYNWSGGSIGSGFHYTGNVNFTPDSGLAASSDDTDTMYGMTGSMGTTPDTNNSRVLYLKSGDAVWDMAGNVWEWTSQTQTTTQIGMSGVSGFAWYEWTTPGFSMGNLPAGSRPSALAGLPGLSAVGSWGYAQGIGEIRTNYADGATHPFLRGGHSSAANNSGILDLVLSATPGYTRAYIGFRVAR